MPGKLYAPASVSVLVGTTVTWRNSDSTNHTVTSDGDAFDSGYVGQGGSFSFTFDRAGRYAYHCVIHRFMKGVVDVFGLVLTGPDRPVSFDRPVVLAGLAPAGTTSVSLRRLGLKEPVRAAAVRPDGSFTVRVPPGSPGAYRAVAGRATSPVVRVELVPRVRLAVSARSLLVTAEPVRSGARAVLQVYDRERFAWRTVARGRLDARSRARFRIPGKGAGRFRAVVRGGGGWADAASPAIVRAR